MQNQIYYEKIVFIVMGIGLLLLGLLQVISVSCKLNHGNRQDELVNILDDDTIYEKLPHKVTEPYDPEIFALDANRGELRPEYFGVKLSDLEKDNNGEYTMTDKQRELFVSNIAGRHMCSLQWISWKEFGSVTLRRNTDGTLNCTGGQKSTTADDYLKLEGVITVVNPLYLKFKGKIVTCVSYINNGKPVVRDGEFNFTVAGQRRYWRMQEMNNTEGDCCDYVDIYFD